MSERASGPGRWRRWVGVAAGPLVAAGVYLVPSGLHTVEGMGSRPAAAAAVALWMAVWWFTEAVPITLTSLLPVVLFPVLGVFGPPSPAALGASLAPFADGYVFLFAGGMALGAGLEHWGLHRRIALHVMRAVGTAPARLLLGVLVATAGASLWISNTATAVMMLPIAMALVRQLEASERRTLPYFGAALALAVAYGANIGGMGTKIGTPGNSVLAGFAAARLGRDIGFLEFMALGLPFVALLLPAAWGLLWTHARREGLPAKGGAGREVLDAELRGLGGLTRGELTVGLVFGGAALLWVLSDVVRPHVMPLAQRLVGDAAGVRFGAKHYEAGVAVAGALLLALLGRLPRAALARVPWSTLLLLGGGFALAAGIEGSGLSRWLGAQLAPLASLPLAAQLLVAAGATVLLSALASNTATVNVMLNVLPRDLTLLAVATLASSCDFALPAGTPPNAIVFGSGRVRLPLMMRLGLLLDLVSVVLLTLLGLVWLRPLLG